MLKKLTFVIVPVGTVGTGTYNAKPFCSKFISFKNISDPDPKC